jgi:hypothetical protein
MTKRTQLGRPVPSIAPARLSEHLFAAILPAVGLVLLFASQVSVADGIRGVPSLVFYAISIFECVLLWSWIAKGSSLARTRIRLLVRDSLLVGGVSAGALSVYLLRFVIPEAQRYSLGSADSAEGYYTGLGFLLLLIVICLIPAGSSVVFLRRFCEAGKGSWAQFGVVPSIVSTVVCPSLWIGLPLGLHLASESVSRDAVAILESGGESERREALERLERWNLLISTDWMLLEWRGQEMTPQRRQAIELAHTRLTGVSPDFLMD